MATDYAEEPAETLESETSGSFFLDPEVFPNSDSLKPGAMFKFVGAGKDGQLEFTSADEPVEEKETSESMKGAMQRAVANPEPMEMKGQM